MLNHIRRQEETNYCSEQECNPVGDHISSKTGRTILILIGHQVEMLSAGIIPTPSMCCRLSNARQVLRQCEAARAGSGGDTASTNSSAWPLKRSEPRSRRAEDLGSEIEDGVLERLHFAGKRRAVNYKRAPWTCDRHNTSTTHMRQ